MPRPLTVRRPRVVAIRRLHQRLGGERRAGQRRRAEALPLSAALDATGSATLLEVRAHIASADLHPREREGAASLHQRRRPGAPPRRAAEQRAEGSPSEPGPPTAAGLRPSSGPT